MLSPHPLTKLLKRSKLTSPVNLSPQLKGKRTPISLTALCSQQKTSQQDEEDSDHSLTRELERAALLPSYNPPNGEFESFP